MNINGISHVFFDLDHTLWDFDKNSALAFQKIDSVCNLKINLHTFLEHYKIINAHYWKLLRASKIDQETLRYRRLNDAFKAVNMTLEDHEINHISNLYIAYLTENHYLIDNAIAILNYLKPNYKLHILTNGPTPIQYKKLQGAGLLNYFETITTSDMANTQKPNSQIFKFALHQAQANYNNSIMIGDSFEADVLGALALQIPAIYFNPNQETVNNSIIQVQNLIELKKYL